MPLKEIEDIDVMETEEIIKIEEEKQELELYDPVSGSKVVHPCSQKTRLRKLEINHKKLEKRQDNLEKEHKDIKSIQAKILTELKNSNKSIHKRLDAMQTAMSDGDRDNLKTIITVAVAFIGAVIALVVGVLTIVRFA